MTEKYPHTESNCNPLLRRQVLYPLSYGGNAFILLKFEKSYKACPARKNATIYYLRAESAANG